MRYFGFYGLSKIAYFHNFSLYKKHMFIWLPWQQHRSGKDLWLFAFLCTFYNLFHKMIKNTDISNWQEVVCTQNIMKIWNFHGNFALLLGKSGLLIIVARGITMGISLQIFIKKLYSQECQWNNNISAKSVIYHFPPKVWCLLSPSLNNFWRGGGESSGLGHGRA